MACFCDVQKTKTVVYVIMMYIQCNQITGHAGWLMAPWRGIQMPFDVALLKQRSTFMAGLICRESSISQRRFWLHVHVIHSIVLHYCLCIFPEAVFYHLNIQDYTCVEFRFSTLFSAILLQVVTSQLYMVEEPGLSG